MSSLTGHSVALVRSVLIADRDDSFFDSIKSDPLVVKYPLKIAHDGAAAQKIISDRSYALAGIFVSPKIERPSWISVLKCACINRPATPLYMLFQDQNGPKELSDFDLKRLGVKENVFKPTDYKKMIELIAPIAISFDSAEALQKAKENLDKLGEVSTNGFGFLPIRAEDFLSGSTSFFDVYVRLGSAQTERYVKLLEAGEAFTLDRLENYLRKGVAYFYIKKEVQEHYIAYCDHIASALLKSKAAPIELKSSQTLNQGEEISKYFAAQGVTDDNLKYAHKFASNVSELVRQIDRKQSDLLQSFLSNLAAYDHGVGTSMLSGMLANEMMIETERPTQIIGMAAMFHDMALASLLPECLDEDESNMTAEQKKIFYEHPQIASLELQKLRTFNPAALQAIEQHHMRLGGQGFPKRSGSTPVGKIAEIIGICDELNRLIQKSKKDPNLDIFFELKTKVYPCFPKALVIAFQKTFFPNVKDADKTILKSGS